MEKETEKKRKIKGTVFWSSEIEITVKSKEKEIKRI
jgi:hypothetical protein